MRCAPSAPFLFRYIRRRKGTSGSEEEALCPPEMSQIASRQVQVYLSVNCAEENASTAAARPATNPGPRRDVTELAGRRADWPGSVTSRAGAVPALAQEAPGCSGFAENSRGPGSREEPGRRSRKPRRLRRGGGHSRPAAPAPQGPPDRGRSRRAGAGRSRAHGPRRPPPAPAASRM